MRPKLKRDEVLHYVVLVRFSLNLVFWISLIRYRGFGKDADNFALRCAEHFEIQDRNRFHGRNVSSITRS